MLQKSGFVLFLSVIVSVLNGCTQADSPKARAVNSGGLCTEEYSREYEKILNLPAGTADTLVQCEEFYANYPGIKCFSVVDGSELRIHTNDFDLKCLKNISTKSKPSTNASPKDSERIEPTKPTTACSRELVEFVITKKAEFYSAIKTIENSDTNDEAAFHLALASKKMCNQFFYNYQYTECPRDNNTYSFYDIKPYCDEFQNILHFLKSKNSNKFSPQEMKPLTVANLKFHFNDALMPIYKPNLKLKDSYLVEGMLVPFSSISSNQNYCYFESEKLRFAGELKGDIYKVDVTYPNKNRTVFTYTSFHEQWRMICHSRAQFYLQDLVETTGDKITIIE